MAVLSEGPFDVTESRPFAVTQLVEALSYKSEGRGVDFRWGL